jgi:hypothetical protein
MHSTLRDWCNGLASLILVSACASTSTSKETTTTYIPAPRRSYRASSGSSSTATDHYHEHHERPDQRFNDFEPGMGSENTTGRHHSESRPDSQSLRNHALVVSEEWTIMLIYFQHQVSELVLVAAVVSACLCQMPIGQVRAAEGKSVESSSLTTDNESASLEASPLPISG